MAQRRMFDNSVINSARFLKMPQDSQNLYFHLGMRADDDGIVEAFSVLRTVGSNEDNLRVLAAKGFIKILNEDLVSYINDWKKHNLIRADRKIDSVYQSLLLQIIPDAEITESKPRADTGKKTGRPMDDEWTAQDRLGEDSVVEDSTGKDSKDKDIIYHNDFFSVDNKYHGELKDHFGCGDNDLKRQFEKMKMWLIANPQKQKKRYKNFILNWLNRSAKDNDLIKDGYKQL